MGPLIVIVIRLITPVFILRWPLGGMVASAVADIMDVVIIAWLQSSMFADYTLTDKLLDTYMLGFAVFVSLRWENKIAKYTSVALFSYRIVGIALLEITGERWILFVFPSVFDFFFVYHLISTKWLPHLQVNGYFRLTIVLLILLAMKLFQEYILHVAEAQPFCWFAMYATRVVNTPEISGIVGTSSKHSGINILDTVSKHLIPVYSHIWDVLEPLIWRPAQHMTDVVKTHSAPLVKYVLNDVIRDFIGIRVYEKQCLSLA